MAQTAQDSPGPAERMFAADAASAALGIELVEHGPGTAVCRMRVTRAMVNGHGIAHGGYLFLFADTAFACACNSRGPVTVAAGADIEFVAPVHEDDVLVATAQERTSFGRSGIYDVTLRRGDEVVAEFRGRSRTIGGGAAGRPRTPASEAPR
ncbi:hydroxyphenylacetyl-CoA thioesterase PaaI [Streptomyces sp. NPDC002734]|uniref:hydroxyphenylacetyl-CoA thioesterase PaaI n=1 Tax=Streptomyces sp. NPDC002734 TaxID=3154426 RepID=UPI00331FFC9A